MLIVTENTKSTALEISEELRKNMPKRISDIGKQLAEAASGQGTRLDVTLENFEELIQDLKDYMEEVKGA